MTTPEDAPKPARWARGYLKLERTADERGQAAFRDRLLSGLSGRVLEVGAGHGPNFPHYGAGVDEVVAIEPEPGLRARAERAAAEAAVPIRVVDAAAESLPADEPSFDAAVCALVLCSVPSQQAALAAIHAALRPGAELRYYEHVVSERAPLAALQRFADLGWQHVAGGCHMARDTEASIRAAGFEIRSSDRFGFAPSVVMPRISHVLGTAVRA
jgi:SAM-dependent methyltransferase